MKLIEKITVFRDKVGKDVRLRVFERFHLSLDAENELTVCGCKTLCDVSDTYLCIVCTDRIVEVWGTGLQIAVYDDTELRFNGNIEKIGIRPSELDSQLQKGGDSNGIVR